MDMISGLAPLALQRILVAQRCLMPEDIDTIDRLFFYLETARPTMAEIKEVIRDFYAVTQAEFESRNRDQLLVFARHVFCYFAYKYARASLNQIKIHCCYTDHTSVHHGVRRIENYALTRPLVRDDLDLIRLRICEKLLLRDIPQC